MQDFKKNDCHEVKIIDLTYEGFGVAKIEDFPFFVANALPGERIVMQITKIKKKFGYGRVLEYLENSPSRKARGTREYLQTGIAPLQHLAYEEQLLFKQKQVQQIFAKFGLYPKVHKTVGMMEPEKYRNKAQVPIRKVAGKLTTGFFKQRSHDFVPMQSFYLHEKGIDELLAKVVKILNDFGITAYNEGNNTGILRHIIVRKAHYTNEFMVILVTRKNKLFKVEQIVEQIKVKCPEVVALIQNINPDKTNVILGKKYRTLFGKNYITDTMLEHKFQIAAPAFYQVNTVQAEKIYQKAIELADFTKDDIVVDAYCGIGTIALSVAPYVKEVYGVEVVEEAIINARDNAKINQMTNTKFIANDATKQLFLWQKEGLKPDVVIVDPPRKGLSSTFINTLKEIKPKKIIYISCNPATFARDLASLTEIYEFKDIYPYDMFPETTHIEGVAALTLKA